MALDGESIRSYEMRAEVRRGVNKYVKYHVSKFG